MDYLKVLVWTIFLHPRIADSTPSISYKAIPSSGTLTCFFLIQATTTCTTRRKGFPLGL